MRFESHLCHLSENKAVVKVKCWLNDKNLGSALAEGPSVELAEDNAISRLNKRLNINRNEETSANSNDENKNKKQLTVELPISDKVDNINANQEPSDWSNELSAIDLELERLKWSRVDEINFLEKNLGYNNRNKITNYSDIVNYLKLLKNIDTVNRSNGINTNIRSLIEESDSILRDLSWDNKKGREYLQKEFNVATRKELDEKQLISFVAKLKSIRNQYLTH
tara:strand:- start:2094 stop:2762 length:669 start_codon:yes stop_codon:yes gene_type:complete